MGGAEFSKEFAEKLEAEIEDGFINFVKLNDSKNIFNAARTPAVFFAIMIAAYLFAGLFGIIGITSFAMLCNFVIGLSLMAIITWAYVRFSGDFREIGQQLDQIAELVWDEVGFEYLIDCCQNVFFTYHAYSLFNIRSPPIILRIPKKNTNAVV